MTRYSGINGWWLPEQFTAEWDHVNYEPFSEGFTNLATGAGAAGGYNEKSNIFNVGKVSIDSVQVQKSLRQTS